MAGDTTYGERSSALVPGTVWASAARGESVILPDGCMDVIWDGQGFLVAGPDTAPHLHAAPEPRELVAVRFDPGIAPTVLGARADELRDARGWLHDLWSRRDVDRWQAVMERSPRPGAALERLVAQRFHEIGRAPEWVPATVRMLRAGVSVERVAREVGLSPRQLQRRSIERFGYGPKLLQRILRVGDATSAIRAGSSPSTAAADHGYADYAHLHRDSQNLLGRSPASFRPRGAAPTQASDGSAA